jgi:hypothetical protein
VHPQLKLALDSACDVVDAARWELRNADPLEISSSPERRAQAARAKAAAYVFIAAALERCFKDVLGAIVLELNARAVPLLKIRTSLFALLCIGELEFQRTSGKQKHLERHQRAAIMFGQVIAGGACTFNPVHLPLDGRTIRHAHFDAVWAVFGLPPPVLPATNYRLALEDLATGRNDVAHGHVDPVAFGRKKAAHDVSRLVGKVEDVVLHLVSAGDAYLQKKLYLR